jgi:hypothetical protein
METESKEQIHPQYKRDRKTINEWLKETETKEIKEISDRGLAELARLKIRYRGFPGARDIQEDLEEVMKEWDLTEETLYEQTRKIHAKGKVFRGENKEEDDWF